MPWSAVGQQWSKGAAAVPGGAGTDRSSAPGTGQGPKEWTKPTAGHREADKAIREGGRV